MNEQTKGAPGDRDTGSFGPQDSGFTSAKYTMAELERQVATLTEALEDAQLVLRLAPIALEGKDDDLARDAREAAIAARAALARSTGVGMSGRQS